MSARKGTTTGATTEVILVPRRSDGGWRDRVWEHCRAFWEREQSHMPIFEGHHTAGLFNRSAAVNRAAALAGDWDVAVIVDSDVICDGARVKEAVALARETGQMVIPHNVRKDINRAGVEKLLNGFDGNWERFVHRRYPNMVSAVIVVPRGLWDAVGGFDEEFRGWGYEDTAFAAACQTEAGITRLPGDVWHLWHPTATEGKPGTATWQVNAARGQRYRANIGNRDAIAAIRAETASEVTHDAIPRIFHRTVPEQTTPQVEKWWDELKDMHPGWRFLTHRDPLDPNDWPLTAGHWAKVKNGAQLADLIRLEALWRYGGIYVDSDVQPVRPFDSLLPLHAFAAWEDETTVPNAVMGARPGHPAIKACLDLAIKRMRIGTWEAGPYVTTKVLVGRSDVLLLSPEAFYPVHYKDARSDLPTFDPKAHPATFAVHHWFGSWLPAEKRWNEAAA